MSQVDEVKAAADIVKIVSDYVQLRKSGVNLKGLCPFHQEKTPSFSVHPTKQIFHCFGCGAGGDVFKFVMLIENLSFPEALRRVAEKVGITLRETAGDETFDGVARDRAALYKIHEVAAKFFAEQLSGTVEGRAARGYLADRGLGDEVVGRFRLGYAPVEGRALTRRLSEAGFPTEVLEKSGLVLRAAEGNRHFDRFRRRIIFPIANESGKLVAFGGRALGDDQPKYLNSPETPIYSKSRVLYHLDRAANAIRRLDRAILVEGYMDCIAVASAGFENVVASCGTSLTESQVRLLGRYSRRVVVNYDPDSAGVAATERSLALLLEEGFQAQVLTLPGGLDPDSFIRWQLHPHSPIPSGSQEISGGTDAYRRLLDAAPSYLDYLMERAASQHDLSTPEGKVAAANVVLPFVAKISNAVTRQEWVNRLAERFRLHGPLLLQELRRSAGLGTGTPAGPAVRPKAAPRQATEAEKHLLRAVLEAEELANEFLPRLLNEVGGGGLATERIFKQIAELRKAGEKVELARLERELSDDEKRTLYESLFWRWERPSHEQVEQFLSTIKRRRLQQEREDLQLAIKAAEREGNKSKLAELLEAKMKTEKELARLSAKRRVESEPGGEVASQG